MFLRIVLMNRKKSLKLDLFNLFAVFLFIGGTHCFPTGKFDLEVQSELRDEKRFPNGTVVGKYSYTDDEGNPIQVKYYADDASYGVELKSIKVVDSANGELLDVEDKHNVFAYDANNPGNTANKLYDVKPIDFEPKVTTEVLNANYPTTGSKYKANDPYDFLIKEISRSTNYKAKPTPDYEIYYQNELKGPKKCGEEKVRIYLDKRNRKIRSAMNNLEVDKFCEQF